MDVGLILGDVHQDLPPAEHLDLLLHQVEAAQRNGITHITIGQHVLYGEYRWLQPIPTLARISAELDDSVTLATTVLQGPLYHPVMLAEELATLDILTRGKLIVGIGAGYRREEFEALGLDFDRRYSMFEESIALIKQTWSAAQVNFEGRYWTVRDGTPHIRPVQTPGPPLWIGAMRDHGVRRAARLGDGWPITPEIRGDEMLRLLAVYEDERERCGLPQVSHPLRREIIPGRDLDDAISRFQNMAQTRLLAYANRSLDTRDAGELTHQFREVAQKEAFLGTPEDCVRQIAELAAVAPIHTVLVRAQWPHMDGKAVAAYLDDLGREIVPAVKEITAVERVVR